MRCSRALAPLFTGFTLAALATEALANPDEQAKQPPRHHRTSEILMRIEEPRGETGSWLEHVGVRKGVGFVYHHQVETDDSKLLLSVGGPVLKGVGSPMQKRKHLGLMFEIKF
jgi:hypothetical protein